MPDETQEQSDCEWYTDKMAEEDHELSEMFGGKQIRLTPAQFTEHAIRIPSGGQKNSFSFEGRRYLIPIYNSNRKRLVIVAGRQTEKSLAVSSLISTSNGALTKAGDIKVGDQLVSMTDSGSKLGIGNVTWVSKKYKKDCIRICTRQRHTIDVAKTHPMRTWGSWLESGNLSVGDRLAVVRKGGVFVDASYVQDDSLIAFVAYMIGDGSVSKGYAAFTNVPGLVLDNFLSVVKMLSSEKVKLYPKKKTKAVQVRLTKSYLWHKLEQFGMVGKGAHKKSVPNWVFNLSRKQTALFLNRLWSTDGYIKNRNRGLYDLEYCSVSEILIRQVQSLLWKFGIPSRIRINWPNYWKKRNRPDKVAFILRIETQEGVKTFLSEIGALGKDTGVKFPCSISNNNRDTYPKDLNKDILAILRTKGEDWHTRRKGSLHKAGLRKTPKYSLTKRKLEEYVKFFESDNEYNQTEVSKLRAHLDTDIYWDAITKIEDIGEQECVDIAIDPHFSFIADGFITHNSTLLGNKMLSYSALVPYFKSLYVSASHTQAKVFSRDRIKEPIEISEVLGAFTNSTLLSNVLEKKFINGSQITLRFAFLNADRCRGIASDYVNIDEFQDVLLDNIPVIEECASHSSFKFFTYSGTPKSLDGSLEFYYIRMSTQNEWVVPCRRHGTPKDPGSWHWNVLDEDNVGPEGLICDECGGAIYANDPDAQWAALNPTPKVEKPFEGYRIPQLMVPWIEWDDILWKQRTYSRAKFHNEVLGRSYDSGTRPLRRQDLQDSSWSQLSMHRYKEIGIKYSSSYPIFMGIDWGGGSDNSYTVMTLGAYLPFREGRFTIFYMKQFIGPESEPEVQLAFIIKTAILFKVLYIGVDYGGGLWPNDKLIRKFGSERIKVYQWVGRIRKKIKFECGLGVPRYLCHRTEVMSDIFNAIKRKDVFVFPRWEEFEDPFAMDFLNIFSEYSDRLQMSVYKHAPGTPDDTFHSCVFNFLASFHHRPRPDIIAPKKGMDVEEAKYDNELDIL